MKVKRELVCPPAPNYMDSEQDDTLFKECVNMVQLVRNGKIVTAPARDVCVNYEPSGDESDYLQYSEDSRSSVESGQEDIEQEFFDALENLDDDDDDPRDKKKCRLRHNIVRVDAKSVNLTNAYDQNCCNIFGEKAEKRTPDFFKKNVSPRPNSRLSSV